MYTWKELLPTYELSDSSVEGSRVLENLKLAAGPLEVKIKLVATMGL